MTEQTSFDMPKLIPPELGLPARFTEWRDGQFEAVEAICQSQKPVFLLDGPTGVGKSLIGVGSYAKIAFLHQMIDRMKGEEQLRYRCVYITRTKQLQDQILQEFPMARKVMGRNNYPCAMLPELTADECPIEGQKSLPLSSVLPPVRQVCDFGCPYKIAKKEASQAPLAVLNDAYFLGETAGPAVFSGADLLVVDEVENVESALMSFIELSVFETQLKRFDIAPPDWIHLELDNLDAWVIWAGFAQREASKKAEALRVQLGLYPKEWSDLDLMLNKQARQLEVFASKLQQFQELINANWIFDYETSKRGWKVTFRPIIVGPYAEKYLWRHGKRALGMSGTIFDAEILANDVGIEDYEYMRMESPFPVENRPIYYQPVVNMTHKYIEREKPKLSAAIDKILEQYKDEKVLIHTVSYNIRDYLMGSLSMQSRLMTHTTEDRDKMLKTFRTATQPMVMISPSFDRGVDLPDDACRCIIVAKMPYLNLGDKQVKARLALPNGQRWYNLRTAQTLVQMCGRGVRSKTDWCHTWILDRQFQSLLARTQQFLPKWWLAAVKTKYREE